MIAVSDVLMTSLQIGKKFWEKNYQSLGIWVKHWGRVAIQKSILHEQMGFFLMSNPLNNLESKYLRFHSVWNLKITLGTIFWDVWLCTPVTQNRVSDNWYLLICRVTLQFCIFIYCLYFISWLMFWWFKKGYEAAVTSHWWPLY